MSRVALKIENYSSLELKALLRKDEKFQQGVRLYACYQVSKGKKPKELEDIYETITGKKPTYYCQKTK